MTPQEIILKMTERRLSLAISQDSLAALSGFHARTIERMEKGGKGVNLFTIETLLGSLGLELTVTEKKDAKLERKDRKLTRSWSRARPSNALSPREDSRDESGGN